MKFLIRQLKHPLSILMAVALGAGVGGVFPSWTSNIYGLNSLLSNLLKMCVIPIVVSALIVEIVSFLQSIERSNFRRFISLSLLISLIFSLCAAFFCLAFKPGIHTTFSRGSAFSEKIIRSAILERNLDEPVDRESHEDLFDLFSKAVPKNVFGAFSSNKTLQIIFFTIVFSFALASVPCSEKLTSFFQVTRESFLKIFSHTLLFLPLLIFTSTALAVSSSGLQVFLDMTPFLRILFLQLGLIFIINLWILHRLLKTSVWKILKNLETVLVVAFGGSVLAATIPALDFFKKFGQTNRQFVHIIAPISMFLNRFGNILYFCFACFFVGQIYGYNFTYEQILFIMVLAILGGIAAAGSTEGITSALLLAILDPINIPGTQLVMILSSLDFLIAPFLSVITVQTNLVLLSFLIPRVKKEG